MSLNGTPVIFTQDPKNIVMCSTNFESQPNQLTTSAIGEITADEILDMPIVFADEPSQDETKSESGNNTFFLTNTNEQKMVIKEEVHEAKDVSVVHSDQSKNVVRKGLNIKQV